MHMIMLSNKAQLSSNSGTISGTCLHTSMRAERSCGVSRLLSFKAPKVVLGHLEPGFSLGSSRHELLRLHLYRARAGEKPLHCNSLCVSSHCFHA